MTVTESSGARFDFERVASRTFGLIARNFVPFLILSLILSGSPYLLILLLQPAVASDPTMAATVGILTMLVLVLAGLILQAALTRASIDDLSGKGVALGTALSSGIAVALPLLGFGILFSFGVGLGLLLLVVPGIYLALRWAVAGPAIVVERLGVFKSMERSAALTENHRWAILGLVVLYVIVVVVLQAIVALVIPGAGAAMIGQTSGAAGILAIVVLVAFQAVTSIVATVGVAAVYFELRQIKEGVDVSELAKVFS